MLDDCAGHFGNRNEDRRRNISAGRMPAQAAALRRRCGQFFGGNDGWKRVDNSLRSSASRNLVVMASRCRACSLQGVAENCQPVAAPFP